jgi:HK97 family phage prohead protease
MNKPSITIPLEVKGLENRQFDGHGSVFGNVDLGGDIVLPGAFKRSLDYHKSEGSLPQMFWMHDPAKVPGKWLDMHEDDNGLAVKGVLAPTPLGNEVHTLLKMEAVRGMSIGYRTVDQDYDKHGNRLIKEAELWEVSVVSLPMNPMAQVAHVKARLSERGEYVPTLREFESLLRDVGCSKTVAKRIIAKVYEDEAKESVSRRDDGQALELQAAEQLAAELFIANISSKLPKFN